MPRIDPQTELQSERDERIDALERRISRRGATGVRLPVALLGIACALGLLYWQRLEVAYLFAPRSPLVLGQEGAYRFTALASNRYAQVHGIPTARGAYSREHGQVQVSVGLAETPIVVHRRALGREVDWKEGTVPPQPDGRPFAVGGRLLRDDEASRYAAAFEVVRKTGQVTPREGHLWLLLEGERPGEDAGTALVTVLLIAFAALNLWLGVRALRERIQRARDA